MEEGRALNLGTVKVYFVKYALVSLNYPSRPRLHPACSGSPMLSTLLCNLNYPGLGMYLPRAMYLPIALLPFSSTPMHKIPMSGFPAPVGTSLSGH